MNTKIVLGSLLAVFIMVSMPMVSNVNAKPTMLKLKYEKNEKFEELYNKYKTNGEIPDIQPTWYPGEFWLTFSFLTYILYTKMDYGAFRALAVGFWTGLVSLFTPEE